jgi:integrase/recombinase XerD
MNNFKLSILFVLQKVKINKKGQCPIKCRITFLKNRKEFSTGIFVIPDYWDSGKQKASPPNTENTILNNKLSLIHQQIDKAFLFLQISSESLDVDDIYRKYKGEDTKEEITILGAYDLHNEKTKKLIGIDFNKLSWSRYVESRRKVAGFIKVFYKKGDVKLKNLNLKFIKDLEYYFKIELQLKHATVYRSIQRVKKIIQFAIAENYLQRDPFSLYKNKKPKTRIVYLTDVELSLLETYHFQQVRLEKVRDLFVFCCYTGLAYQEMTSLTTNNIQIGFDGNEWVEMYRQKTGGKVSVPLLPQAKAVLKKYNNELPSISNQKFNAYLKEITGVVGIEKKLTHHIARKTFATTVLLLNNVSMEVVSELLGHSNIKVTQASYAKVVNKKVSEEMKNLHLKFLRK